MAVITPYAQFLFKFVSETPEYVLSLCVSSIWRCSLIYCLIADIYASQIFYSCSKNVTIRFARRTDVMPLVPLETKHHPSSVDLLLIKRLVTETSKQNLLQFLQHEFVNIRKSLAERLIGKKMQLILSHHCPKMTPLQHKKKKKASTPFGHGLLLFRLTIFFTSHYANFF